MAVVVYGTAGASGGPLNDRLLARDDLGATGACVRRPKGR